MSIIPIKDDTRMADYAGELESRVAQDLGVSLRMYRQGGEVLGSVEREVCFAQESGTPVSLDKIVAAYGLSERQSGIVREYAQRIDSLYGRNVQGATASEKALGAGAALVTASSIPLGLWTLYSVGIESFFAFIFAGAAIGGAEAIFHANFQTSPFTELVRLGKSAYSAFMSPYTALRRSIKVRALREETQRLLTMLPEEKYIEKEVEERAPKDGGDAE